jgi:hypothetical protein
MFVTSIFYNLFDRVYQRGVSIAPVVGAYKDVCLCGACAMYTSAKESFTPNYQGTLEHNHMSTHVTTIYCEIASHWTHHYQQRLRPHDTPNNSLSHLFDCARDLVEVDMISNNKAHARHRWLNTRHSWSNYPFIFSPL